VQPLAPPEGVVAVGGDWRLSEWSEGGFVTQVGLPAAAPTTPAVPEAAASAASR